MTAVSFDPMAQAYDAMRGYPEDISQQIAQAIDQAADGRANTRYLEVGTGTGRIALPIVTHAQRNYTGIDISEKMLGQFEQKLMTDAWQHVPQPWGSVNDEETAQTMDVRRFVHDNGGTVRLVLSDMTALPFRDASFDVVIAAYVFHVVRDWKSALQEIQRVLRPGGILIRSWKENWPQLWIPGTGDIRKEWNKIVQELGGTIRFPGATEEEVTAYLQAQGFSTETWEVLRWQRPLTMRMLFESLEQYQRTGTWSLPDDLFAASLERLHQWADTHLKTSLDEPWNEEERLMIGRTPLR